MQNQKALPSPSSLPFPAHRQPPTEHATSVTRAYRLGKCETLHDLYTLLANERCSAEHLQREIVARMQDVSRRDPAILGHKHLPQFQERQGTADACIYCFDLIAVQKLRSYDLCNAIADCLFAAWPPEYMEYRARFAAFDEDDPAPGDTGGCFELRQWYAAVDALNCELACAALTGLPPSEDQARMEAMLLFPAGETVAYAQ